LIDHDLAGCGIVDFWSRNSIVLTPLMAEDDIKEDKKVGTLDDHSSDERIQATGFILHQLPLEDVSKRFGAKSVHVYDGLT
jgi:hypothetical protein